MGMVEMEAGDWDGMEPSQYADMGRGQPAEPGVKRLIQEVLEDAIRVVQGGRGVWGPRRRKQRAEASAWFESAGEWAFSFRWCCDALGMNPEAIRVQVKRVTLVIPHARRFGGRVEGRMRAGRREKSRVRQGGGFRSGAQY